MTQEACRLCAVEAAAAWRAVQDGGVEDASLHESVHHQVTLALEQVRAALAEGLAGAPSRLESCLAELGGDDAVPALAAPWLCGASDAPSPECVDLVALTPVELDRMAEVLGTPAAAPDDAEPWGADVIVAGSEWRWRGAGDAALDAAIARRGRQEIDRLRAAGQLNACWQVAARLHAFGGAQSAALATAIARWLGAAAAMEPHLLASALLAEWRSAAAVSDDASAWRWAGGQDGGADDLAELIVADREQCTVDAVRCALLALVWNPMPAQSRVDATLERHPDLVDERLERAVAHRRRIHRRWTSGRVAWAVGKLAVVLVIVLTGVAWVMRERELDASAREFAEQIDAAVAQGFEQGDFTTAQGLLDAAASQGVAARDAVLAAGARLRDREQERRAREDEVRAAFEAAGAPTAVDAPVGRVTELRAGLLTPVQAAAIDRWLAGAAEAAQQRADAAQAALDAQLAAVRGALGEADAALAAGADARPLLERALESLAAIEGDDALPATRGDACAALRTEASTIEARLVAEEQRVLAITERAARLDAVAALVGDPAACVAQLRLWAAEHPDDPLAPEFNAAGQWEDAWVTAVGWRALADELAADALPASLASGETQRQRLEAWLATRGNGPGVAAARRYLALLPKDHAWAEAVVARVRGLDLDELALVVMRDGTRQWHKRSTTPVDVVDGARSISAVDSVNQTQPTERVIDTDAVVTESAHPLAALLTLIDGVLPVSNADAASEGADGHGEARALELMDALCRAQSPAAEPPIDPVLRLYLARLVALRAQESLPALASFLRPTIAALDREGITNLDWMAPMPAPDQARTWKAAEALAASISALDLPGRWRDARAKSAVHLRTAPGPMAMLCWERPGGAITPNPVPANAGWVVWAVRSPGDGIMDEVGVVNHEGRVTLVRPDRIRERPSGTLLFVAPPR